MPDDNHFNPEQLDRLEQQLWQLIDAHSFQDKRYLPPVEDLVGPEAACELYAEALNHYAVAIISQTADKWQRHSIVKHLDTCPSCQDTLTQLLMEQAKTPAQRLRLDSDMNITMFDKHLEEDEDTPLRSAIDRRRPVLLSSGFLEHPPDWHYTLEGAPDPITAQPGIRVTLLAPTGNAAHVPLTMVLFGQILNGVTDEQGIAYFSPVLMPAADTPDVPVLNLRLRIADLALP